MAFPYGTPETSHLLQWGSFLLDDSGHEVHKDSKSRRDDRVIQPAGKCPVNPTLEGGVKGHNTTIGKYLTGKPRPSGR